MRQQQPEGPFGARAPGGLGNAQMLRAEELEQAAVRAEEDSDFSQRLEQLKVEGREKAATLPRSAGAAEGAAAGGAAVFDAQVALADEDIYANPPSLVNTMVDQLNSDISDPALRCVHV